MILIKTVIFIDRFDGIIKNKKNDDAVFVVLNLKLKERLERLNLNFMDASYYKCFVSVDKKLVKIIRRWWNREFEAGKNFKNSFVYNNLSFSWMLEDWIFGNTPYSGSIIDAFEFVELVNNVIEKEKPRKIILISDDERKKDIFLQLKDKYDIKLISGVLNFKRSNLKRGILFSLAQYRNLIRKLLFGRLKKTEKRKGYKILSFATKNVNYIEKATGNRKYGSVAEAIYDKIDGKEKYEFKIVKLPPKFFGIRDLSGGNGVRYVPIENYLNISSMLKARKQHRIFYKKWVKLKNNPNFRGIFNYRGINIWKFLVEDLDFFFSSFISRILIEIEMYKNSMTIEKPDLIIHDDFSTVRGIEIMAVARELGIRNIALQHGGSMIPLPIFIYDKKDLVIGGRPIPDLITAHGLYNKRFLIKNSKISPSKIKLVGDPQYDLINEVIKSYDMNKICNDLGIERDKRIILFAPSTSFSLIEKRGVAEIFFDAVKKLDFQIIVKFHPRERETFVYENEAMKNGIKNVKFLRDYDILKLIYISDAVVSTFSSVNLEAVLVGRFSIIIDMFNKNYMRCVDNSRAIFNTTSERGLYNVFKSISENRLDIGRHRNIFIKNLYYKLDGKTCERIGKIIKTMVE